MSEKFQRIQTSKFELKCASVQPGFTVFIGGMARLDVLIGPEDHRWAKWPLILTLFAAEGLPVNVVK